MAKGIFAVYYTIGLCVCSLFMQPCMGSEQTKIEAEIKVETHEIEFGEEYHVTLSFNRFVGLDIDRLLRNWSWAGYYIEQESSNETDSDSLSEPEKSSIKADMIYEGHESIVQVSGIGMREEIYYTMPISYFGKHVLSEKKMSLNSTNGAVSLVIPELQFVVKTRLPADHKLLQMSGGELTPEDFKMTEPVEVNSSILSDAESGLGKLEITGIIAGVLLLSGFVFSRIRGRAE